MHWLGGALPCRSNGAAHREGRGGAHSASCRGGLRCRSSGAALIGGRGGAQSDPHRGDAAAVPEQQRSAKRGPRRRTQCTHTAGAGRCGAEGTTQRKERTAAAHTVHPYRGRCTALPKQQRSTKSQGPSHSARGPQRASAARHVPAVVNRVDLGSPWMDPSHPDMYQLCCTGAHNL